MSYYIMIALTLSDSLGKLINYRLGPTFKFWIRAELHALQSKFWYYLLFTHYRIYNTYFKYPAETNAFTESLNCCVGPKRFGN